MSCQKKRKEEDQDHHSAESCKRQKKKKTADDNNIESRGRPAEMEAAVRADNVQQFDRLYIQHWQRKPIITATTKHTRELSQSWLIALILDCEAKNIIAHCVDARAVLPFDKLMHRLAVTRDYRRMFTLLPFSAFRVNGFNHEISRCLRQALEDCDMALLAETRCREVGRNFINYFINHNAGSYEVLSSLPLPSKMWLYDVTSPYDYSFVIMRESIWAQGCASQALTAADAKYDWGRMKLLEGLAFSLNTFVIPPFPDVHLRPTSELTMHTRIFAAAVATNNLQLIEHVVRHIVNKTIDIHDKMPRSLLLDYALEARFSNPQEAMRNGFDLSASARASTIQFLKSLWYGPESNLCRRLVNSSVCGYASALLLFRHRAQIKPALPLLPTELWLKILHYVQPSPLMSTGQLRALRAVERAALLSQIAELRAKHTALDRMQTRSRSADAKLSCQLLENDIMFKQSRLNNNYF